MTAAKKIKMKFLLGQNMKIGILWREIKIWYRNLLVWRFFLVVEKRTSKFLKPLEKNPLILSKFRPNFQNVITDDCLYSLCLYLSSKPLSCLPTVINNFALLVNHCLSRSCLDYKNTTEDQLIYSQDTDTPVKTQIVSGTGIKSDGNRSTTSTSPDIIHWASQFKFKSLFTKIMTNTLANLKICDPEFYPEGTRLRWLGKHRQMLEARAWKFQMLHHLWRCDWSTQCTV